MVKRPTISSQRFHELRGIVPAPVGHSWQWDPAASGDRLRLFRDAGGGDSVVAYAGGEWAVNSPEPGTYLYAAQGKEADIVAAMRRGLAAAKALGWDFGSDAFVVIEVVRPSGVQAWIKATREGAVYANGAVYVAICRDHEHETELEARECEKNT